MGPREPDRVSVQEGGLLKRRPPKRTGSVAPVTSASVTLKAVKKAKAIKPKKIKSRLQEAAAKRAKTLKALRQKKKVAVKRKVLSVAKKKIAVARKAPRRLTVKKKVVVRPDARAMEVQRRTATIKAKAKAQVAKGIASYRAKIKEKASAKRTAAGESFKARLTKINERRVVILAKSKREAAGRRAKASSTDHKLALGGIGISGPRRLDADFKRKAAAEDNVAQQKLQKAQTDVVMGGGLQNSLKGRNDAVSKIGASKRAADDAAAKADSALTAGRPMDDNRTARIGQRDAGFAGIKDTKDKIAKKQADAATSDAMAKDQDIKRSKEMADANIQKDVQDQHNAKRNSASDDIATQTGPLNAAKGRLADNEANMNRIKQSREATVGSLQMSSDRIVSGRKADLDRANMGAAPRTKEVADATAARKGKEGEAAANDIAIAAKRDEVSASQDRATQAGTDNVAKKKVVDDTAKDLESQKSAAGVRKGERDAAEGDVKKNIPERPASDQVISSRRDTIKTTELPDQKNRRAAAEDGYNTAKGDLYSAMGPIERFKSNKAELDAIPGNRASRLAVDADLNVRRTEAKNVIDDTRAARDANVAPLKGREAGLQRRQEHSDGIANVLAARQLDESAGIKRVPKAELDSLVSSKQHSSSVKGAEGGKQHAGALKNLGPSQKHLGDIKGDIKLKGDDAVKLDGQRNEFDSKVAREKDNAIKLDLSRKTIPERVKKAREQGDMATAKAGESAPGLIDVGGQVELARAGDAPTRAALADAKASFADHNGRAKVIGADADRIDGFRKDASNGTSKARGKQGELDAKRKGAADEIKQNQGQADAAAVRKKAAEDNVEAVKKKNAADMDAIKNNSDGMVKSTKDRLDEAGAAGKKLNDDAAGATKARTDKEVEADKTKDAITAKLDEVNAARAQESAAAGDYRAKQGDTTAKQGDLDRILATEPGIKDARKKALDDAEAATPTRNADDAPTRDRKKQLDETDMPAAKAAREKAGNDHDRSVGEVAGPGGILDRQYFNGVEIDSLKGARGGYVNKNSDLARRVKAEVDNVATLTKKNDAVKAQIQKGHESIQGKAQHGDAIDNVLKAKGLGAKAKETKAEVSQLTDVKQTSAKLNMGKGSKKHAVSEDSFNKSKDRLGEKNDTLGGLGAERDKLRNTRGDLDGSITKETGNRAKHKDDLEASKKKIEDTKLEADGAGKKAKSSLDGQGDLKGRPGGIEDMVYLKESGEGAVKSKREKIGKTKADADAAAKRADDANGGRNAADSTAAKRKGEMDGADGARKGEAAQAKGSRDQAEAARARKLNAEAGVADVQKKHKAAMDAMAVDANGTPIKRKKELDDATAAAADQFDTAGAARKKREGSEADVIKNKNDIEAKNKERADAYDNEAAAKKKHDDDLKDMNARQADLDGLNGEKPVRKKNRDDAEAEAELNRPARSPDEPTMKKRQLEIDDGIKVQTARKNAAGKERWKRRAELAEANAKKKGLPGPEDQTDMRKRHEDLKEAVDSEIAHGKRLAEGQQKLKTVKQKSLSVILGKQILAGTIAGMILDLINRQMGVVTMPPLTVNLPPFVYPVPSASGATISNGAAPIGMLDPGTGDKLSVVTGFVAPPDLPALRPPVDERSRGYNDGAVAGNRDGRRDGTADANEAFTNKGQSATIDALKQRVAILEVQQQKEIDDQVAYAAQEAYCGEVKEQGAKQGLDIFKVFGECTAFFNKTASGPAYAVKASAPRASTPITDQGEFSGEAMSGGYREDLSGVMQLGGAIDPAYLYREPSGAEQQNIPRYITYAPLPSGPSVSLEAPSGPLLSADDVVIPVDEYDLGYVEGYHPAYKTAYTQTYSLTMAIKIAATIPKKPIGYGEAVEKIINKAPPKIITERDTIKVAPKKATGASIEQTGPTVGGGLVKRAKSHYKRGKTLIQHARLLDRIAGKTKAERSS